VANNVGGSITFLCPDLKKTIETLERFGKAQPEAVRRGMTAWSELVSTESKRRCPVATGTLRGTIHASTAVDGSQVHTTIGAGGPAAPYALSVHENPRSGKTGGLSPRKVQYKTWSKVGEWKYLENPIMEAWRQLDAEISHELERELEKL